MNMNTSEIKTVWEDVKKELEKSIPEPSFIWIDALEAISFEDNQFTLISGQSFAIQYLQSHHYKQILESFKIILNQDVVVNFEFDKELAEKIKKEEKKQEKKEEKAKATELQQKQAIENLSYVQSMNLNLQYRFDNFVTDTNNRLAKMAAESVAKNPNAQYNPLYIYGGSGLGKTHLMQAIGHALINNKKIRCVKSEDFINEYINSTGRNADYNKSNLMNKFRQKYRNVDVLLIDDIQFIEGKKQCMEELFNTLDSLLQSNKQIVLTSDRLPKDMPEMPQRLTSRFEQGLVVEINPPEKETRLQILKNIASNKNLKVPEEVFDYIATYNKENVRKLKGALNTVEAYSSFENTEITIEFAKQVLNYDEISKNDIETLANKVANCFNCTVDDFKSSSRTANISNARAICAYIAREKMSLTYESIATYLNKKHQTILYSCDKIKEKIKNEKDLKSKIEKIMTDLNL